MKEKFSLKDHLFNKKKVTYLASLFAAVDTSFDQKKFVQEVMKKLLDLELKERITWIAKMLENHLPRDFAKASALIIKALPAPLDATKTDDDFGDFIFAPLGEYVVQKGREKKYLIYSFVTLEALTQRFSMEDAMRSFLNDFPKETLREYKKWMKHKNYHVRRLVSESTRPSLPWSRKLTIPYITMVPFLNELYSDKTRYVTRSVANHLNDISKKDPQLAISLLTTWKKEGKQVPAELEWMTKHALRTLIKEGNVEALSLLGFDATIKSTIDQFSIEQQQVMRGEALIFECVIRGQHEEVLLIDYIIDFVKSNGNTKGKVFKLKKITITGGQVVTLRKRHVLRKEATTFTIHPGVHRVTLQINGKKYEPRNFTVL